MMSSCLSFTETSERVVVMSIVSARSTHSTRSTRFLRLGQGITFAAVWGNTGFSSEDAP